MPSAIEWISKRAKQIQKQHPRMAWVDAREKATSQYHREKPRTVGANRKGVGTAPKTVVGSRNTSRKLPVSGTAKSVAGRSGMGAVEHVKAAKHVYEDEYGLLAVNLLNAKSAAEKKNINKRMTELRKTINKIDSLK